MSKPPAIEHVTQNYFSLRTIILNVSQRCGKELANVLRTTEHLPDDTARRMQLLDFVVTCREQYVKLYVLCKWAVVAGEISRSIDLANWLHGQINCFNNAIGALYALQTDLGPAKAPWADLDTALQVLTHGEPQAPPEAALFVPQKPLDDGRVLALLRRLDVLISLRLALHEQIPVHHRRYKVHDGRARFYLGALGNFWVDLSIADDEVAGAPRFFYVDCGLQEDESQESAGPHEDLSSNNAASTPPTAAASTLDPMLKAEIEGQVNAQLLTRPLVDVLDMLAHVAAVYRLQTLDSQLTAAERGAGPWAHVVSHRSAPTSIQIRYFLESTDPGELRVSLASTAPYNLVVEPKLDIDLNQDGVSDGSADGTSAGSGVDNLADRILREATQSHAARLVATMRVAPFVRPKTRFSVALELSAYKFTDLAVDTTSGKFALAGQGPHIARAQRRLNDGGDPAAVLGELRVRVRLDTLAARAEATGWRARRHVRLTPDELAKIAPCTALLALSLDESGWCVCVATTGAATASSSGMATETRPDYAGAVSTVSSASATTPATASATAAAASASTAANAPSMATKDSAPGSSLSGAAVGGDSTRWFACRLASRAGRWTLDAVHPLRTDLNLADPDYGVFERLRTACRQQFAVLELARQLDAAGIRHSLRPADIAVDLSSILPSPWAHSGLLVTVAMSKPADNDIDLDAGEIAEVDANGDVTMRDAPRDAPNDVGSTTTIRVEGRARAGKLAATDRIAETADGAKLTLDGATGVFVIELPAVPSTDALNDRSALDDVVPKEIEPKENESKETESKESEPKDGEFKGDESKENESKDGESKDSESKESESKESEDVTKNTNATKERSTEPAPAADGAAAPAGAVARLKVALARLDGVATSLSAARALHVDVLAVGVERMELRYAAPRGVVWLEKGATVFAPDNPQRALAPFLPTGAGLDGTVTYLRRLYGLFEAVAGAQAVLAQRFADFVRGSGAGAVVALDRSQGSICVLPQSAAQFRIVVGTAAASPHLDVAVRRLRQTKAVLFVTAEVGDDHALAKYFLQPSVPGVVPLVKGCAVEFEATEALRSILDTLVDAVTFTTSFT